ncbi:MAG: hypothetical protein N2663_06730 [Chlorobi bacterium]|nr:hypothetical protein [Chlorobiota bacterium]
MQDELIAALGTVSGDSNITCTGAGHTDARVHAVGQVAHSDVTTGLEPTQLCDAINNHLPTDIHIRQVEPVSRTFDARRSAVAGSYLYHIALRGGAFTKNYAWWVCSPLDIERMEYSGELLERVYYTAEPQIGSLKPVFTLV